jgi:hypothetical protein
MQLINCQDLCCFKIINRPDEVLIKGDARRLINFNTKGSNYGLSSKHD